MISASPTTEKAGGKVGKEMAKGMVRQTDKETDKKAGRGMGKQHRRPILRMACKPRHHQQPTPLKE